MIIVLFLACSHTAAPQQTSYGAADTGTTYTDTDTDYDTDLDEDTGVVVDSDGDGWPAADDCDDEAPEIHPGAEEVACDGLDNDCDGWEDGDDDDGDGYADLACGGGDCDDSDPSIPVPGGMCHDNDCDGVPETVDSDGDGWVVATCDGYVGQLPVGDCDDTNAGVNPDALEMPDGHDNDCDGYVD